MNITVSSVLLMILMGFSVVLLIVSAIFLDGVVETLAIKSETTKRPQLLGALIVSIDLAFKESRSEKWAAYKANDINLACCSLVILIAFAQFIFSTLLLFKILPKLVWGIVEALLVIVFGLALAYAMWIFDSIPNLRWSTGRHEAFVAFVGLNALFLPPTIVYVMFAESDSK